MILHSEMLQRPETKEGICTVRERERVLEGGGGGGGEGKRVEVCKVESLA